MKIVSKFQCITAVHLLLIQYSLIFSKSYQVNCRSTFTCPLTFDNSFWNLLYYNLKLLPEAVSFYAILFEHLDIVSTIQSAFSKKQALIRWATEFEIQLFFSNASLAPMPDTYTSIQSKLGQWQPNQTNLSRSPSLRVWCVFGGGDSSADTTTRCSCSATSTDTWSSGGSTIG